MSTIDKFRTFYQSLSTAEKETVLKHAYDKRPRPWIKTSRLLGYENTGSGFDLDLADGQSSESPPSGKYEFKEDFMVSETGNLAIEVECDGKPSGISATDADWWWHWLSGEEYRKEVAIVIVPRRLRRIADSCYRQRGGDNGVAINALVSTKKVLASDSEIQKFLQRQAPQIRMFE